MRVAADPSPLVRDGHMEAFARFELLFDEMVATAPMVVLCGYDRRLLTADTIAQMCFVHPLRHLTRPASPAGLHADGSGGWNLIGPLDFASREHFMVALSALPERGDILLYLDRLRFCDVAVTRAVVNHAATLHPHGRLILHDVPPVVRQMLDIGWPGDRPGLHILPTG